MATNDRVHGALGPDELRGDDVTQYQSTMTTGKKAVRPLADVDGTQVTRLGGTTPSDVRIKANTAKDASGTDLYAICDADGKLIAHVEQDIEIGAVEIKDATTATRAVVKTDATDNALVVFQNIQPLPTGASTSANQTTGNASLASIDGKLAALGQKAKAGSVPVTLASDEDNVNVDVASSALPSGAATEATLLIASGDTTSIDGKTPVLGQALMAASVPVAIASDQSTIPTSVAALPLPAGAATEATLLSIKDTSGIKKITDQLPAGTNLIGKVGIDQTTPGTTNRVDIGAALPAGTNNIGDVDVASSALPSGASTSANQTTGNSSLAIIAGDTTSIDSKTPAIGQSNKAGSVPVTLASDEDNVNVDVASSALPSGAATSANQTTGNASLAIIAGDTTSVDGKTPALGQAVKASSVPVTMASDQEVVTMNAPTFATVGAGSASALAANASRKSLDLVNDSDAPIYLGFGAAAVVGSGMRLNANGGNRTFEGIITTQQVFAISTGAAKNLGIQEGV